MTIADFRDLLQALGTVEIPTLGHTLDEGFCSSRLHRAGPEIRMAGRAVTLDLLVPDAVAVNRALVALVPGDVLVIRVRGGEHAPVGAVTVAAAAAKGVAGIVVDGPVTDLSALAGGTVPVYATGTSARTTKLLDADEPRHGTAVKVAGVTVRPGDIVLGDENGVLVIAPDRFDPRIIEIARASDDAEPAILDRIARGDDLAQILTLTAHPSHDQGTELA